MNKDQKLLIKKFIPNFLTLMRRHKKIFGFYPNLLKPKTFNERIIKRMLNDNIIFSQLSDKIEVRKYIGDKIGLDYLIPVLWVGDHFHEKEISSLPTPFILKANHGSGTNEIVYNINSEVIKELRRKSREWLSTDFSKVNLEKHYSAIKPKIYAEKLLLTTNGSIPADYKVHCFTKSNKYFIQVDYDRFGQGDKCHKRNIYDEHWHKMNFCLAHDNLETQDSAPLLLNQMLALSKIIAEEFDYVRVDWYIVNNNLYFGEITFTHGAGTEVFMPATVDRLWGDYWGNE